MCSPSFETRPPGAPQDEDFVGPSSTYDLTAVLVDDIARDTGFSTTWLFASFSVSLIISGGANVLLVTAGLSLAACLASCALRIPRQEAARHAD